MKRLSFKNDIPRKKKPREIVKIPEKAEDEEGWINAVEVSEITGPVVLHRDQKSIAYNGRLFILQFDGVPDDVRQVFVVTKRGESVSLKNCEGGYLSADLSIKDAVGEGELWTLGKEDGFTVMNKGRYLTMTDRIEMTDLGPDGIFKVLIQRRHRKVESVKEVKSATTRAELERKVGRALNPEEVDALHRAEVEGVLNSTILDMRVRNKSDKFG